MIEKTSKKATQDTPKPSHDLLLVFNRTDEAMYAAKQAGCNCAMIFVPGK